MVTSWAGSALYLLVERDCRGRVPSPSWFPERSEKAPEQGIILLWLWIEPVCLQTHAEMGTLSNCCAVPRPRLEPSWVQAWELQQGHNSDPRA
jgi:hypothetical protein